MNTMDNKYNDEFDDEIDLRELYKTLLKHKISIFLITFLFFIGSLIFAYYKPNIYSSNMSLEILKENKGGMESSIALNQMLLGSDQVNLENEKVVLQSRFIVQKALEKLDLDTKYYVINRFFKKIELYKDAPFDVKIISLDDMMYGKTFELIPIDSVSFRLEIKPLSKYSIKGILATLNIISLDEKDKISYNQIHHYNELIKTPYFTIMVDKLKHIDGLKYNFSFIKQDKLYDFYKDNLSVKNMLKSSSVLELTYQDTVSLRAKEILDAISTTYIATTVKQKTEANGLTLNFIDTQLKVISANLKNSEKNLENYKIHHSVVDLKTKLEVKTQKIAEYEGEQLELQTEINILNNIKYYINKNKDLTALSIGTVKFTDNRISLLVTSLEALMNRREQLASKYTQFHPDIVKIDKSIKIAKKAIKKAVQNSLDQLNQRSIDLGNMVVQLNKSLESLPTEEKKLAQLLRPLKVNQKIYEFLLQKRAETAILKSATIANARILDSARENTTPVKPKRVLIVVVSVISGLIIGIFLAFLREFFTTTLQSLEELEHITSLPIYGVIPYNKDESTENTYKEAFRNLRTNLQFLPESKNHKIISITSSISGEGKTTISTTLGEMLAKGDKKVILLDLDLRKSSFHTEFEVKNDVGVSNYLIAQNKLSEIIQTTNIENLDIIPTGPLPPNPSELILSKAFTKMLEVLKKKYDYIIIDTPPAGLVTDAIIVMNYSDLSLFLVRANYTKKEFIKNIDKLVKEYKENRVGIIFNGATINSQYGYYGYYNYYK
ncbi:Tyrosine-protein kinase Wzc [hydrothermal vent metagenome]|uniref:non-specific protein-tyrosine kinase n=1 Tax=hydrothermal vent metagenome TaxID=652676 RepID=A0A1W1D4H7_9ZZZZ